MTIHRINKPYLLLIGDTEDPRNAKTAFGLRDWTPAACLGQLRFNRNAVDLGLPEMSPQEAATAGAKTLVIGIAPVGGRLPDSWHGTLLDALEAGLDLAAGLHQRLGGIAEISACATRLGRQIHDVRHSDKSFPVGSGERRSGKRLLTVGTDCALGKKYTALAIAKAMTARGHRCDFRATGQTGILISGEGVAVDAVVADFIAGAAEALSPANAADHWDIIEGQGSLFHPSYAAVSLGLLHGSQPDVFVVCHEPGRKRLVGHPEFALPSLPETIDLTLRLGRRTNPAIRCGGISLNTSALETAAAHELLARESMQLGLPVADPIRKGPEFQRLIESCLA